MRRIKINKTVQNCIDCGLYFGVSSPCYGFYCVAERENDELNIDGEGLEFSETLDELYEKCKFKEKQYDSCDAVISKWFEIIQRQNKLQNERERERQNEKETEQKTN